MDFEIIKTLAIMAFVVIVFIFYLSVRTTDEKIDWHVFFICWVSWAGKWTLIKAILEDEDLDFIEFVKSCKTRELRPGEVDWVDYIKLSVSDFKEKIMRDEFLEYNFVHNQNYYWTLKVDIIDNWIKKWKKLIKEIDPLILPTIIDKMSDYRQNMSIIFLDLPIEEIKNRMQKRWDDTSWADYENRIASARREKENIRLADYVFDWIIPTSELLDELKDIIYSKL